MIIKIVKNAYDLRKLSVLDEPKRSFSMVDILKNQGDSETVITGSYVYHTITKLLLSQVEGF